MWQVCHASVSGVSCGCARFECIVLVSPPGLAGVSGVPYLCVGGSCGWHILRVYQVCKIGYSKMTCEFDVYHFVCK